MFISDCGFLSILYDSILQNFWIIGVSIFIIIFLSFLIMLFEDLNLTFSLMMSLIIVSIPVLFSVLGSWMLTSGKIDNHEYLKMNTILVESVHTTKSNLTPNQQDNLIKFAQCSKSTGRIKEYQYTYFIDMYNSYLDENKLNNESTKMDEILKNKVKKE